jgi:hypothetical protein
MTEKNLRPFPTPPPEVRTLFETKLPGSRTQMFGHVISAVDAACGEAEAEGDPGYVRYCYEKLFPFLEAEKEKAAAEEGLTAILRWEESLFEERGD